VSITLKYFRIRLLILGALIVTAVGLATGQQTAVACEECVFPSGGICVGCMAASGSGYRSCVPNQSSCTCSVGGGSCRGGSNAEEPEGGGGS
jgi:hypothetical protein